MSYGDPASIEANERWAAFVESRRNAPTVESEVIALSNEDAQATVRVAGAFITRSTLVAGSSGELGIVHESTTTDHQVNKLGASHLMHPVGKNDGPGGQHGAGRWLDYRVIESSASGVVLESKGIPAAPVRYLREIWLPTESGILVKTSVTNTTDDVDRTSVGEHTYLSFPVATQQEGILVDGHRLDDVLGKGAEQDIMSGKAKYWDGFDGITEINFPDGRTVRISATAKDGHGREERTGMLFWARPNSGTIGAEPVAGYSQSQGPDGPLSDNSGMLIDPRKTAQLNVLYELL